MTKSIYTISPTVPFAKTLADGLWHRAGGDNLALSRMLVLLPTRRACRYVRDAFLAYGGEDGGAVLPPRLSPLGDLDEDEWIFADGAMPDLPPAISPLRRQHKLASLICEEDRALSLEQALLLADALGRFLDEVLIEDIDLSRLSGLVDQLDLAEHWQETVRFLNIITNRWPEILAAEGCIDAADRRNRVLRAQATQWRNNPPDFPIIAAGSTGTMPATAELLDTIASLPNGCVILPGLDQALDETAWQESDASHPQYAMRRLLEKFGVDRKAVKAWGQPEQNASRSQLLSEIMRPAATTESWRHLRGHEMAQDCLTGLSIAEFEQAEDEASAIALLLRESLQEPEQKAVLVTPDRELAARVAAHMQRWDVTVNDSAGRSLTTAPVAAFLLQVLEAAQPGAKLLDQLALLKHPIAACGIERGAALALARMHEWRWRGGAGQEAADLCPEHIAELQPFLMPITSAWTEKRPLLQWIDMHLAAARSLAATPQKTGDDRLWEQEEGEAVASWFDQWRGVAADMPSLNGYDYAQVLRGLLQQSVYRPSYGQHPRLSILGLLEARMVDADLVILGAVNEGIWPPAAPVDPWLSRPMRAKLGLPSPDRRLGLAAHDFTQLASLPRVVVTSARRRGGVPAVPSRFILQLHTVTEALGLSLPSAHHQYNVWAEAMDSPVVVTPCDPPSPRPPAEWRPRRLSVTDITTWQRNPYAIYAKHILRLRRLDPLVPSLDAAERGNLIHDLLERFIGLYKNNWPTDALDQLLAMARQEFDNIAHDPAAAALFWPRFEIIARLFVAGEEDDRASGLHPISLESKATWSYGDFTLSGRVDRIDQFADGDLRITDYKTGTVPNKDEVTSLIEPQLPLLALMARDGSFADVKGSVRQLRYQKLAAGSDQELKETVFENDIGVLVTEAEDILRRLVDTYADADMPYLASPIPALRPRYDDYTHLARMAEWGRFADETEDNA